MTLYNAVVETGRTASGFDAYSVKTPCTMQFNVPERNRVIDHLTKNYGRVVRIEETNKAFTHIGLINI